MIWGVFALLPLPTYMREIELYESGVGDGPLDMSWLNTPKDAKVFLKAVTSCDPLPLRLRPFGALVCASAMQSRSCMGVEDTAPFLVGR